MLLSSIIAVLITGAPISQAGIAKEFAGVRSTAMAGAQRGVGTSNDTLYLNPAGMALTRRYAVEGFYGYSPLDNLSHVNGSIVDSSSGPLAGGFGYTHVRGDSSGVDASINRFNLAMAIALNSNFGVGVGARYFRGAFNELDPETGEVTRRRKIRSYNGDFGLLANFGGITAGLAYQNAFDEGDDATERKGVAGGLAYDSGLLVLAGDVLVDLEDDAQENSYALGLEYLMGGVYPLRAGYRNEPRFKKDGTETRESILSGGTGYVTPQGALDVAFTRSLERARNWNLVLAVRLFI